jgi:thiol-disulfide isomerase/thioredoxin
VEDGALWLSVPGIDGTVRLPIDDLRTLLVLRDRAAPAEERPKLSALFESEGVRLTGRLVDGPDRPGAGPLVWQPDGSATASPLRAGVSARIVYKETPPAPVQTAATGTAPFDGMMNGAVIFRQAVALPNAAPAAVDPALKMFNGVVPAIGLQGVARPAQKQAIVKAEAFAKAVAKAVPAAPPPVEPAKAAEPAVDERVRAAREQAAKVADAVKKDLAARALAAEAAKLAARQDAAVANAARKMEDFMKAQPAARKKAVAGVVVAPQPPVVAMPAGFPAAPGGMVVFSSTTTGQFVPQRAAGPARRALYLRSGDVIPSEVVKIDEEGVTYRSPMSKGTFVAHDKIKAIELAAEGGVMVRLNVPKRDRLLTLPRVQKGSPPTHLVRSTNGDYLRGRVVAMDDKTLQIEVRAETRSVPRDRVSRIIWLHPEEADPARAADAARVQAVRSDGTRLTFTPQRVSGATLSGTSDVLGPCQVRLDEVDQILIGGAVASESTRLAYQRWKLTDAPEPTIAEGGGDDAADGRAPGTSSPLVGKPAPDFSLELLDGKTFRLSEAKGQVVVLDFWATWCGPCLQAMPQVEKAAGEFRDQGVKLVAVNLQEAPKDITAMLERHQLKLTVALDKDGVVAQKYAAHAIPQTVVVGRDGTVSRLFVGGGPRLGDQLRDALKAALEGGGAEGAEK